MKSPRIVALIFALAVFSAWSISSFNHQPIVRKYNPKPSILPKGDDYKTLWNRIDSLQSKGLYKSAFEVTVKIFDKAVAENNHPQVVKAMIHKLKFNQYIQEDDYIKGLSELEKISATAKPPLKQIVHSITAEVYFGYYQRNRWKFYDRSRTTEYNHEDISTWDLVTLSDKVRKEYLLSLSDPEITRLVDITSFEDILYNLNNDGKKLRPTVYDFLAHRAFDFFSGNEFDVTRPAYTFKIDKDEFISDRKTFLAQNISSQDTMSTKLYAMQILQDLVRFHEKDQDPYPLVVAELRRLQFVNQYHVSDNKDSLYLLALEKMADEFKAHESWAEIQYYIARYYRNQASKYRPMISDEHKRDNNTALEICEVAKAKFPKSHGAGMCQALISEINQKTISVSTVETAIPDQPSIMNINYTNVKKVYLRIINIGWDFKYDYDYDQQDKFIRKLIGYTPVKQWEMDLKDDGDHNPHSIDGPLQGLPRGVYLVLACTNKDFKYKNEAFTYTRVDVSDISFIEKKNQDEEYEFHLLSRSTGAPLAGAKAKLFYIEYDYRTYRNKNVAGPTFTADENGYFKVSHPQKKESRYFTLEIIHNNDKYVEGQQYYQYKPYKYNNERTVTHFFTDRKIYRPGQTIYFKGIRIRSEGNEKHELVTGQPVTVTLYDVNHQKVTDLELTTNEFGSFSGTFTAPQGVLTGQMRLGDGHGNAYFSVEEYKRPKFEVSFKPVEGTYKLGSQVKALGTAKAYSGVQIDGAEVKYRVVRSVNYWRWYWWWGSQPSSGATEITNGTTTTDENGNFTVEFTAIPDKSTSKKYNPTFSYTVYADVTDINGETRSSSQTINAGYRSINLNFSIDENVEKSDDGVYTITTQNLNYNKIEADVEVNIYKVKSPDVVLQDKKLPATDRHLLSKEEFKAMFPNEIYTDEDQKEKWPRGEKVFTVKLNTKNVDSIYITNLKSWPAGMYVAEAVTKEPSGEEVKDTRYFTVFGKDEKTLPYPMPFWFQTIESYREPGETASFVIGSGFENVKVLYEIEHKGKVVSKEWITLNNEQKLISIPVEEKHRGNFAVHFSYVKNNRFYVRNEIIYVPYTNKMLDIEFETFRNKLYPGQDEEWKIKLKGKKGEKVAAELLLTMYDASLDAFAGNSFYMNVFNSYYDFRSWNASSGFYTSGSVLFADGWNSYNYLPSRYYYSLNWFGYYPSYYSYGYYSDGLEEVAVTGNNRRDGRKRATKDSYKSVAAYDMVESESTGEAPPPPPDETTKVSMNGAAKLDKDANAPAGTLETKNMEGDYRNEGKESFERQQNLGDIKARTNLAETAFFFPQLETNENGEVTVKFKMPESLTKWKIIGMGHTRDLSAGTVTKELITQKDLMILPNMPRFLRENDKITISTKISNVADEDLTGVSQLMLFDAFTMKPVDGLFGNNNAQKTFNAKGKQSTSVSWDLTIPEGVEAVIYRIVAKAKNFTDGEEAALPVLSNRMLVTESMPLHIRKKGTKEFNFEKLINSKKSSTLRNHRLTLEYTSNPAWYAIQALPYLMEYPHECAEQIFSRFYANSIASHIMNSNPKIKNIFESWKNSSPESFLSNLEKNQELKSVILEETPWVMEAKDESERKKRIGLLMDFNRMSDELDRAIKKLQKMQVSNGGWPWFPGMPESRYITQHIVTGMGHLDKLGVKRIREDKKVWDMVQDAVRYLDHKFVEDYKEIKRRYKNYKTEQFISQYQIQYMYARSYFKDIPIKGDLAEALSYYKEQARTYWLKFNIYSEAMLALAMNRFDDKKLPVDILKSLKERVIIHEELGAYWKENVSGYYWYEAPIETQAMMIECFDEVGNDIDMVNDLKVWLLKNKQTNAWQTTKATTEACYALLMRGEDWLADDEPVEIVMADKKIDPRAMDVKTEAGTGYYKIAWSGDEIKPEMGKIKITSKHDRVSWGALHWQYFEQLDKITTHATPLRLTKMLFRVDNTPTGPIIKPIGNKNTLKVGDLVRVRIELRVDRDMEYIHMKDMRAAGFEPVNVFSQYKYQGGLGYYQSTRDAATNFFFDRVSKGTYVFEYDLRVAHSGDFSNGITQIQCMYAPEFNSHSEGIRVEVKNK